MRRRSSILTLLAAPCLLGVRPSRAQVPGSALARVLGAGQLRVGITLATRPYAYRDPASQVAGLDVDVMRLITEGLDVLPDFVELPAIERIAALREARVDVLTGLAITPRRARQLLFCTPYMQQDYGVAMRGTTMLRRPSDFSGHTVAVQGGSEAHAIARQFLPPAAQIRTYPDIAAAGEALVRQEVEAMITRRPAVRDLAQRHPEAGIVYRFTLTSRWMSMAVAFGEHDLLRSINTLLFQARENGRLGVIVEAVTGYPVGTLPAF